MRKLMIGLFTGIIFFSIASFASAHAVGGKPADAPTLIKQSIDFLVGGDNISKAEMKAKDAFYAVGIDSLNKDKLNKAINALEQSDEKKAENLLVETLGQNPKNTNLLELKPHYTSSVSHSILLVISVIFILFGFLIIRSAKPKTKTQLKG